jgi:hypothetical protein
MSLRSKYRPEIETGDPSTHDELRKLYDELDRAFEKATVVAFPRALHDGVVELTDGIEIDLDLEINGPVSL